MKKKLKSKPKKRFGLLLPIALVLVAIAALLVVARQAKADSYVLGATTMTATGDTLNVPYGVVNEVSSVQLTGITGTAGVQLQGSLDKGTWVNIYLVKPDSSFVSLTATANGIYQANTGGFTWLRVKAHYIASGVVRVLFASGKGASVQQVMLPLATVTPVP